MRRNPSKYRLLSLTSSNAGLLLNESALRWHRQRGPLRPKPPIPIQSVLLPRRAPHRHLRHQSSRSPPNSCLSRLEKAFSVGYSASNFGITARSLPTLNVTPCPSTIRWRSQLGAEIGSRHPQKTGVLFQAQCVWALFQAQPKKTSQIQCSPPHRLWTNRLKCVLIGMWGWNKDSRGCCAQRKRTKWGATG